jgi:hypothetical protein
VPASPLFIFENATLERRSRGVLGGLPLLEGRPIRIQRARGLRDSYGPVHAASYLRERRIAFDCRAAEFPRIFVHELFHFVWVRAGNRVRWSFEEVLRTECRAAAAGELGWSSEWRKQELPGVEIRRRGRRWREYCCESFCDTAAWIYAGVGPHPEFTLAADCRKRREAWFHRELEPRGLSI